MFIKSIAKLISRLRICLHTLGKPEVPKIFGRGANNPGIARLRDCQHRAYYNSSGKTLACQTRLPPLSCPPLTLPFTM